MKFTCEYCNLDEMHFYNGKHLCLFHYWVERGRPLDNRLIDGEIRYYRRHHPIWLKHWRSMDTGFSAYVAEVLHE